MLRGRVAIPAAILFGALSPMVEVNAQQAVPTIGVLRWTDEASSSGVIAALREGLRDLGYVEGQTIHIEYRFADGRSDRAAALAAELVQRQVELIVASATPAVHAARNATRQIPIVMATAADPVGTGLVASIARPGGNVTGISLTMPELAGKRLQLLHETIPGLKRVAFLASNRDPAAALFEQQSQAAARSVGIELRVYSVGGPEEFDRAFMAISAWGAGALIVQPLFTISSDRIPLIELAMANRLPTISDLPPFARSGGLLSYGPNAFDAIRRAASYVHRILKGGKPAELPIEEPTTFELVVNLKTARALGIEIPQSVLARADEVIE